MQLVSINVNLEGVVVDPKLVECIRTSLSSMILDFASKYKVIERRELATTLVQEFDSNINIMSTSARLILVEGSGIEKDDLSRYSSLTGTSK